MPYFLFEPDAPAAVHELMPLAASHPHWTYVYQTGPRGGWYTRDTRVTQWLPMVDAGVPENYRLELLLLQAAHP